MGRARVPDVEVVAVAAANMSSRRHTCQAERNRAHSPSSKLAMEPLYRHTQVSRFTLVGGLVAGGMAVLWSVRLWDPAPLPAVVILGIALALFSTLTVTVDRETVTVAFGPGVIRRRIPLDRIREARVVRTPWYYGWGIRLTPRGWLWNVWGLEGVEVEFQDGHHFRIGTDDAQGLAAAVRRAIDRRR